MDKIQRVDNNQDKRNTYQKYLAKYNNAIKYECYLEAIMIDYAMLEDRFVAFLHHVGVVTRTHENLGVNKLCRKQIRELLGYKENSGINVSNIKAKMNIVKALLTMEDVEDKYLLAVDAHLSNRIDKQSFVELIDEITTWCVVRNQYVHALLNKNYDALQDGLREYAENGLSLARRVDKLVKATKRNCPIRKKFKVQ